ncbi:MAG: hypothetical protein AB1490_06895 [Pseudomonadota bacterium]
MPPDLLFWLALFLKMAVTAAFVVGASIIAEKSGPAIGAMIATLPIAAAPAYIILSFDHDSAFIANGAIGSLAANAVTGIYSLIYAFLAQRRGLLVSLGAALIAWFALGYVAIRVPWTVGTVTIFNIAVFTVCVPLVMHYCHVKMPPTRRRWFDIPLRASLVAFNVAVVVTLSSHVGPAVTGQLAVFPIVLSSLILIFHPRIGGPATAALIANGVWGLAGFSVALIVLHLAAVQFGTWPAYGLSLATSIVWNFTVWSIRRRQALRASRA